METQLKQILDGIIGYLNLSDGRPSPAFQKSIDSFYRQADASNLDQPWEELRRALSARLSEVSAGESVFGSVAQAEAVVPLVFEQALPAYRRHHRDLLFHASDTELFAPYFVARVCEAVLQQGPPWAEFERVVSGTIRKLNDYVGHRPVATLENERRLQPYDHEHVRPIPLYLRGVGTARSRYEPMINIALDTLQACDERVLASASLDPRLLDELAVDPRAYDYGHPADRRPANNLGEWDPHHIDAQGRFRRFVLRRLTLDALFEWTQGDPGNQDRLVEAGTALAGSILLASCVSGWGPGTHSSETNLGKLVQIAAQCRDNFYRQAEARRGNPSDPKRQPFANVRQHVNEYLSRQRAKQLQHRHLAQVFALMGYSDASRQQADLIACPSVRMRTEIQLLADQIVGLANRGEVKLAGEKLAECEALLHRAIECGAMVDPWNILGFQGNYALWTTVEDTVKDPRVDDLLLTIEQIFDLYARVLQEAAAQGKADACAGLEERMQQFAEWWDQFASFEVSDLPRVCGRELVQSSKFVAHALALWRESGAAAGDVTFWRQYADEFNTAKACSLVVEVLLDREDYLSSMALLMHWLSEREQAPLEESEPPFDDLALRWMRGVVRRAWSEADPVETLRLILRFVDSLEANADNLCEAPGPDVWNAERPADDPSDDSEDRFSAAYEGVTFRDSAEDGVEGSIEDGDSIGDDDSLVIAAEELLRRFRFLSCLAQLWQAATSAPWHRAPAEYYSSGLAAWRTRLFRSFHGLAKLCDSMERHKVALPTGSPASILEYDRRAVVRLDLLGSATAAATNLAVAHFLLCQVSHDPPATFPLEPWERGAVELQRAIRAGDVSACRAKLTFLLDELRKTPILYLPIDRGGSAREIFTARYVRALLYRFARQLPRLGLYRETYRLLARVHELEAAQSDDPSKVTEFNLLFLAGYRAVIEHLADNLARWSETRDDDDRFAAIVGEVAGKFGKLWIEHIGGVRLSEIERPKAGDQWEALISFVRNYGRDLFTQEFMNVGNLRGILQQGVEAYLEQITGETDPLKENRFVRALEKPAFRTEAAGQLDLICRIILEQYDVYREYNATTTASDYGDNLHILLELIRIKIAYERNRWALQPALLAHSVLSQQGRLEAAERLSHVIAEETSTVADGLQQMLAEMEARHSVRLASVRDRLAERFLKPLALDRMLALVRPAIEESADAEQPAFAQFLLEIRAFTEPITGTGLDVPDWLDELEEEVDRVLFGLDSVEPGLDDLAHIEETDLSFEEFQRQLQSWDDAGGGKRRR